MLALTLAVVALRSDLGGQRLSQVATAPALTSAKVTANDLATLANSRDNELRQATESVRLLAADRDRLIARVATIEQNLEDVTGSVGRIARQPAPAATSSNHPIAGGPTVTATIAALSTVPATPVAAGKNSPAANAAAFETPPAAQSVATKTEFGIDIGGASNLSGLRDLWSMAKANHPSLLGGMVPIISVRDGSRTGSVELRLIAGPLTNAKAAARLCASFSTSGWMCRPTVFDGQRLASH